MKTKGCQLNALTLKLNNQELKLLEDIVELIRSFIPNEGMEIRQNLVDKFKGRDANCTLTLEEWKKSLLYEEILNNV